MNQLPSGKALWSLLWRATVWFPFALAKLGIGIVLAGVFLLLATWAVVYTILQEWWSAGGCLCGVAIFVCAWTRLKNRVFVHIETENDSGRGGWVL